jgi:hypothetical protein
MSEKKQFVKSVALKELQALRKQGCSREKLVNKIADAIESLLTE